MLELAPENGDKFLSLGRDFVVGVLFIIFPCVAQLMVVSCLFTGCWNGSQISLRI